MDNAYTGLAKRVGHGLREFQQSLRSNWRNNWRGGALALFLSLALLSLPANLPKTGCLLALCHHHRRALGHPFTAHNLGDLFPFKVKESQIPPQTPSSSYSLSGERGDEQTQADD